MGKKLDNQPFATINYIYGGACEIQVYPDPFSEMVRLPFRFLVLQTSKTSSWGHKIIQNPQESYQESGWSVPRILVSNRIWNFREIIRFDEELSIGMKPLAVAYTAPNQNFEERRA